MKRVFDADTAALRRRADLNAAGARHDLEDWIVSRIGPCRGKRVLDLGCGTGKQLFRLAPLVTGEGQLLGVDISTDAVREVNERAKAKVVPFVAARRIGLDECLDVLAGSRFDLIVSTYAIYYAAAKVALLEGLRSLLAEDGVLFVCGPGDGTNREIVELVNRFIADPAGCLGPVRDFLSAEEIAAVAPRYARVEVARLENVIRFESPERLLQWWRHHNSFVASVADEVARAVERRFATLGEFTLTKNVLGVRFDA